MSSREDYVLPVWARRVRKKMIARLYESSARHLIDEELLDEVGYALLARCESMLDVQSAQDGRVPCPCCRSIVNRTEEEMDADVDAGLLCQICGWTCTWFSYRKTFRYKNMGTMGMKSVLMDFVRQFPKAQSPGDRLILIDMLIHRFHWEGDLDSGRPGAATLIEGKMKDIMPFLDKLNYGDHVPPEAEATRARWRKLWRGSNWEKQARRRKD